jgi:hypothetical protein
MSLRNVANAVRRDANRDLDHPSRYRSRAAGDIDVKRAGPPPRKRFAKRDSISPRSRWN